MITVGNENTYRSVTNILDINREVWLMYVIKQIRGFKFSIRVLRSFLSFSGFIWTIFNVQLKTCSYDSDGEY